MWIWFIIWVFIIWLILSGGSYYGYRRAYYPGTAFGGVVILWLVLLLIALAFVGPGWGYYGYWW